MDEFEVLKTMILGVPNFAFALLWIWTQQKAAKADREERALLIGRIDKLVDRVCLDEAGSE